jgi:hypothetical protein
VISDEMTPRRIDCLAALIGRKSLSFIELEQLDPGTTSALGERA